MSGELLQMFVVRCDTAALSIETVKKSEVLDCSGDANVDPYDRGPVDPETAGNAAANDLFRFFYNLIARLS